MKKEIRNVTKDTKTILNGIRAQASDEYKSLVPILGTPSGEGDEFITDNLADIAAPITQYRVVQNEFVSALVNRIGLVIFKNLSYSNPLKILKRGTLENGETIEEIWVGLAKSYDYKWQGSYTDPTSGATEENPFKRETPDIKAYFHYLNVAKVFKTTYTEELLSKAFTSADGVYNLVSRIIESVFTSYEIFEWEQTKKLLADAYTNGDIITQTLTADPTTEAGMKAMVKKARALSTQMTFPSDQYNSAGVVNTCPRADQIIIMTPEIEAAMDVDVLASAFNMDRTTFLGNTIMIDKFPEGMENVKFLVVSRDFFVIYDKLIRTETVWNGAQLYWNVFLHVWQLYSYSKLVNAVAFTYPVLSSIAVTTAPTKTTYSVGDTFDTTGMVVTATYSDSTTKAVTDYTYSPTGALAASDTAITISYTEDGVTKTTSQAITVS